MKGIILAGGSGTRLYPITLVTSKQLLPIYDKPMIYYPLSILMLAGIREILVISTPDDIGNYQKLLSNGNNLGIEISYAVQLKPEGLAQAFIIGENFIGNDSVAMILGDNIFYGNGLSNKLSQAVSNSDQGFATIFGYYVNDPERFGIVELGHDGEVISLEEKPSKPKSNYCVTGLYFYDNSVVSNSKKISRSKRGEYEITDLNNIYLSQERLRVELMGRGYAWLDTGTVDSLLEASDFVRILEHRQGIKIAALEEIAYKNGWIDLNTLKKSAEKYGNSPYGQHLINVVQDKLKY